jgi:hypothetical protein
LVAHAISVRTIASDDDSCHAVAAAKNADLQRKPTVHDPPPRLVTRLQIHPTMKRTLLATALPLACLVSFGSSIGCAVAPDESAQTDGVAQASAAVSTGALRVSTTAPVRAAAEAVAEADTCVEPGRYIVEDGVVVDQQNAGRRWQRAADGELRTQPDALAYCEALALGGQGGWRLPTVQELGTLKLRPSGLSGGPQYCYPSIDHQAFPGTPSAEFWTSTTRPAAGDGLETGFDDGRTHPATLDTPFNVRCVHDGGPTPGASQARAETDDGEID